MGRISFSRAGVRLAATACFIVSAAEMTLAASPCGGPSLEGGLGRSAVDGRTALLADGREIILVGIEVPPLSSPAGVAARAAFETLIKDQPLTLSGNGQRDRYGRVAALAFRPAEDRPLQQILLAQGQAQMAAKPIDGPCAAELRASEKAARTARLGLWADPEYVIREAGNGRELEGERGHFVIVSGKVVSVRQSGQTIYMNFGRRWSQALTVTIPKRLESRFTAAQLEPKSLANRHVRIRGYVEERNGPRIQALSPGQIEIAEQD